MADWGNYRLIVHGRRESVSDFSRRYPVRQSSKVWGPFYIGEVGELSAERIRSTSGGLARKAYVFQASRNDPTEHFKSLSRLEPDLVFVLVNAWPNSDSYGSELIQRGSVKLYWIPQRLKIKVMAQHGVADIVDDDDEERYWEASWELMDLAEAHWDPAVARALR